MARINVDDDVESRPEYRKLLKLVGDDDRALGMLVRFWRHAQKLWGHGKLVPHEDMETWGWDALIDSRWALEREGGFYAIGSEDRFAWYVQKIESASAGGRARAAAPRDDKGRLLPNSSRSPAGVQPDTSRSQPESSPLSPALSLSPVKDKYIYSENLKSEVNRAAEEWKATLKHYGAARELIPGEDYELGRQVAARKLENVLLAIVGARYQQKSDRYDPAKFLSLDRIFRPGRFQEFVNLGVQARQAEIDRKARREEVERARAAASISVFDTDTVEHADPERVRALIESSLRGAS